MSSDDPKVLQKKEQLRRKAMRQARREMQIEKRKQEQKEFQDWLKSIKEENQKDLKEIYENEAQIKASIAQRRKALQITEKQANQELKEARITRRKRNQLRRRKRFQEFFSSQRRIWWQNYLSLVFWILLILGLLIGILYGLKALGIDLVALLQPNTT